MRNACQNVLILLSAACISQQSPPVDVASQSANPPVEVVLRNTSWEDPELAAKGLGRLEVVVRAADRPAQVIQNAMVQVKLVGDYPPKQKLTDQRGIALFDSTSVGNYEITIKAIGYGSAYGRITVSPGCRTDAEVYIGVVAIGLDPPPREPSRIRLTTCRTPQRMTRE